MFHNVQQDHDFFFRLNFKQGKSDVLKAVEWLVRYKIMPMINAIPDELRSWEMFYTTSPNFVLSSSGAVFAGDEPMVEGIMLHMTDDSSFYWSAGDDKVYRSRSEWKKESGNPGNQTVQELVRSVLSSYRPLHDAARITYEASVAALKMVQDMGIVTGDPRAAFKYFYQSCKSRQINVKSSLDQLTHELVNEYKRAKVAGSI